MRSMSLLILTLLASGCGGGYGTGPLPPSAPRTVDAVGVTAWSPTPITIQAGQSVTFRNGSATEHNVRFDDVAGRPADLANFASTSRSVTFATAGTYTYHCGIHPAMQGRVVVQP